MPNEGAFANIYIYVCVCVCVCLYIFGEEMQQKKYRQCEKSGSYQHLNKMDILGNGNGNVNKVMI